MSLFDNNINLDNVIAFLTSHYLRAKYHIITFLPPFKISIFIKVLDLKINSTISRSAFDVIPVTVLCTCNDYSRQKGDTTGSQQTTDIVMTLRHSLCLECYLCNAYTHIT